MEEKLLEVNESMEEKLSPQNETPLVSSPGYVPRFRWNPPQRDGYHRAQLRLPEELINMIFEYASLTRLDQLRFGSVCQSWRSVLLRSAVIDSTTAPVITYQQLLEPYRSWKRLQRLHRLQIIALMLISFPGVCFGVNWGKRSLLFHSVGFCFSYLILFILVFLIEEDLVPQWIVILVNSVSAATLAMTQYKLSVPSSPLLWVEVISPLYLLNVLIYPILLWIFGLRTLDCNLDDTGNDRVFLFVFAVGCLIVTIYVFVFAPLFFLTFYCYQLDRQSHSQSSSSIFGGLLFHYIFLFGYFLFVGGFTADFLRNRLRRGFSCTDDIFISLVRCVSAFVGPASLVLLLIQFFTRAEVPLLSGHLNPIFYLSLILQSLGISSCMLHQDWGEVFHG
jgi:hypothetical protein